MKTSHILLAIIAVVTLTGMVATDVLLKQQYEKIDWNNLYQTFERRSLSDVKHVIIKGSPDEEIIIEQSKSQAQALMRPERAQFFRVQQRGDTAYVTFTTDADVHNAPKNVAYNELPASMVLRLPDLRSLHVTNGRLTLQNFKPAQLTVSLLNSRLRTNELIVAASFELTESRNSFAVLGADRYQSLRLAVRDSSGIKLNDTQTEQLSLDVSARAEVQLLGQALRWLAK